jgi:hypothetical protein
MEGRGISLPGLLSCVLDQENQKSNGKNKVGGCFDAQISDPLPKNTAVVSLEHHFEPRSGVEGGAVPELPAPYREQLKFILFVVMELV